MEPSDLNFNKTKITIKTKNNMTNTRITPEWIAALKPNEIFVFGSNLAGRHAGGAARIATDKFGAEWGVGVGRTGQTYAIPTMKVEWRQFAHTLTISLNMRQSIPNSTFWLLA